MNESFSPHAVWTLPFIGLLICIALIPLISMRFWDSNRNKAIIAGLWALPALVYLFKHQPRLLGHSLHEYISFVTLVGSLFLVSSGLWVDIQGRSSAKLNTILLAVGAVSANFIGTTGASLVFVRPFLRLNQGRKYQKHLGLFFILCVSNFGGLLTPIGDPPLFMGYLKGVPFFWSLDLLPIWLFSLGWVLIMFFIWDSRLWKKETVAASETRPLKIEFSGQRSLLLLGAVIACVFLPTPWRELSLLVLAMLGYFVGSSQIQKKNEFSFHPLIEVAVLFAGIFITMAPALEWLAQKTPELGLTSPRQFFWLTGILSGFLDNAPTYLSFFSIAQALPPERLPDGVTLVAGVSEPLLRAISAGAVLMGANSYIGNGPNFMVKAICEQQKIRTLSFFGYFGWAALLTLPLYLFLSLIFF